MAGPMNGATGAPLLAQPAGGMDGLSKRLIETACKALINTVMRRGRSAYVVVIAADGPHGALVYNHENLNPEIAVGFAEALEDRARKLREEAKRGVFGGAHG